MTTQTAVVIDALAAVGKAGRQPVAITLTDSTATPVLAAYVTATSQPIVAPTRFETDAAGRKTVALIPNDLITPSNSCWLFQVGTHRFVTVVPDVGPVDLMDILAMSPTALGSLFAFPDLADVAQSTPTTGDAWTFDGATWGPGPGGGGTVTLPDLQVVGNLSGVAAPGVATPLGPEFTKSGGAIISPTLKARRGLRALNGALANAATATAVIMQEGDSIFAGGIASSYLTSEMGRLEATMIARCPASTRSASTGFVRGDTPAVFPYPRAQHWLYGNGTYYGDTIQGAISITAAGSQWMADTQTCDGAVFQFCEETTGATVTFYYRASTNGAPAPDGTTGGWTSLGTASTTNGALSAIKAGRLVSYALPSYAAWDVMAIASGSNRAVIEGWYPAQGNRTTGVRLMGVSSGGHGFCDALGLGVVAGAGGGTSSYSNLPTAAVASSRSLDFIDRNLPPAIVCDLGGNDWIAHNNLPNPATAPQLAACFALWLAAVRLRYDTHNAPHPTIWYRFTPYLFGGAASLPATWTTDYRQALRNVAQGDADPCPVTFVDGYEAAGQFGGTTGDLTTDPYSFTAWDGLHPNDAGHAAIFEAHGPIIAATFTPALGQTKAAAQTAFVPFNMANDPNVTPDPVNGTTHTISFGYNPQQLIMLDALFSTVPIGVQVGLRNPGDVLSRIGIELLSTGVGRIGWGPGSGPFDITLSRTDTTHLSLGADLITTSANPVGNDDLVRRGYLGTLATQSAVTSAQMPAYTGDVTSSAGTTVNTITALPLTKLATQATGTVLGNRSGSTGTPTAMTGAQTMALLSGTNTTAPFDFNGQNVSVGAPQNGVDAVNLTYYNAHLPTLGSLGVTGFGTLAVGTSAQYVRGDAALATFATDVRANRVDQMAAPTAALAWTSAASLTIGDGTAAHGSVGITTTAFGSAVSVFANSSDTQPKAQFDGLGRMFLGNAGGSTAPAWSFVATASNAGTITGATLFASDVTHADATNIVVNTTTGTKLGTATGQKLGLWNATPIIQPTGATDILTGLINMGARASGANPPLNMGTGALTATGTTTLGATTAQLAGTNVQVGTTYTLALTDASKLVTMNNASAMTLTIPANGTIAFPVGTILYFWNIGAGTITLAITTDTLRGTTTYATGTGAILIKSAATTWYAFKTA